MHFGCALSFAIMSILDYSPEHITKYLFLYFTQALLLSIVSFFYWCYTFMSRVWLRNVIWPRSRNVRHQKLQCIYLCLCSFHFHDYIIEAGIFARLPCHKSGRSRTCKFVSQRHVVASNLYQCCESFQLVFGWWLWRQNSAVVDSCLFDLILITAWLIGLAHSQCCNGAMLSKSSCVRLLTGVFYGVCRCRFQ